PFRVWIERVRVEERDPFDAGWKQGSLVLQLNWPPNVHPLGGSNCAQVTMRDVVGDDGKPLQLDPKLKDLYPNSSSWGGRTRAHRQFVRFEHPAPGVKRLGRLRGTAGLVFPQKIETV